MPFLNLDEIEQVEKIPGYFVRFVHSANMTFAYWSIKAGYALPEHSHRHEQVATMLSGKFELVVGGEKRVLEPGMVAIIPSDVRHSGLAVTDCTILDTFYPIREDDL